MNSAKKVKGNWRFERKFALKLTDYLQFEKLVLRSDLSTLHPDRQINNCYLDDTRNTGHTDSIEGYGERQKTRIRWYGTLYGEKKPKLEFKIKQNNSNVKESYKLFPAVINESFDWDNYLNEVRNYLLAEKKFFLSDDLHPVLINSYKRKYYSNIQRSFRLTIDRDLEFIAPDKFHLNRSPFKSDIYIIELKSENSKILSDFPWVNNLGKFSKYSTGRFSLY